MGVARALRSVAGLCILIGCCAVSARATAQNTATKNTAGDRMVEALFVNDIHFEPFADPAKAARLKAAPVSGWNAILAEPASADQAAKFAELQQACKARGADTSYALYQSSLAAMKRDAAGAKFVVLSGDLVAHEFSCKYEATFHETMPGEYRAFVEKTINYVMRELRAALPGVPVYAALGNNDSDCGDYQLDPDGAFLAEVGKTLTADLPAKERTEAQRVFGEAGYYSASLPVPMEHTRILVLDDLFMSRQYATCGGKPSAAPAAAQVSWLTKQLDTARRSKEKVWVMSHIPPGVNPYATAMKVLDLCSGGKPQMFLSSEALPDAMSNYGDVITLAIFAHTHMDEMRLLKPTEAGAPPGGVAVKVVGSISPVDGNNPSFTVAEIDAATAQLKDYQVFVASNQTGPDASPNWNSATQWSEEYDFAKAYNEPAFTAATVADLVAGFKADPTGQSDASKSYIKNYGEGSAARAIGAFWQPYTCALRNDGADAFRECVCGGK
jgi:sphingomyelin phosphodiesterase acid-like 3